MIISNIKCQLREIYLVKYKLANKILYKKLFLRISLYLQENTCLFNQVAVADSNTGVSYEYFEILKNTYFEEHLWTAASNYGNLGNFLENKS